MIDVENGTGTARELRLPVYLSCPSVSHLSKDGVYS